VFFWRGVISEIPKLFEIWRNPKIDNIMYMENMLKDWSSPHLLDCGWYFSCSKENTPSSKFKRNMSWDFFKALVPCRRRYLPKKKRGVGGRERETLWSLHQRCRTRKMFPLNSKKKQSLAWAFHLFKKFQQLPLGPSQLRKRTRL
jgi:hypothetical protein